MTEREKYIYSKIDEILWNDWDPIGVNKYEDARDEYYSYIPQLYSFKKAAMDIDSMASWLYRVETEVMGLTGDRKKVMSHCREIARKIIDI